MKETQRNLLNDVIKVIEEGDIQQVEQLLKVANKDDKKAILGLNNAVSGEDGGISLLSYAVSLNNIDVAKALINTGIDSDASVFVTNANGKDRNSYSNSKEMKSFVQETEERFDIDEDGRVTNTDSLQKVQERLEAIKQDLINSEAIRFLISDPKKERATTQKELRNIAENIHQCPMSIVQFLMKTVSNPDQIKISNKKLSASIDKLQKAMERIASEIKVFFTKGNGKVFLEALTSFIKNVKDFFIETIPGITSEIWSKVEEKVIIPIQEQAKLLISHAQEITMSGLNGQSKGDVKKIYDEYRDKIRDEAAKKKIESVSRGAVNSREGRRTLSEMTRKEGFRIALYNEEESKFKEKEADLQESIESFRAMFGKTLDASDIEDLSDIGIEVAKDTKSLNEQQVSLLVKKLEEFHHEYTKIVQVLDDSKQISKVLESKKVNDTAKKIIEKRFRGSTQSQIRH